jgi:FMN phosphatase YigB (HAD superfamily)
MSDTSAGAGPASITFLLDVDNTLLDNDRLKRDLGEQLRSILGTEGADEFWRTYEEVRAAQDYVDYPTTIARWIERHRGQESADQLAGAFARIDFRIYLYPDVLETIERLWTLGTVVILSDGDSVFQPRKIRESGLEGAVRGNVLIYIHKEDELPKVFARYPAGHYVMVDDKPRILSVLETCCPATFTTIQVLQGHYAVEGTYKPEPDLVIERIGDLRFFDRDRFLSGRGRPVGMAAERGSDS